MFCDHNEKLASHGLKKFFKIVTVIFIYFAEKYLSIFSIAIIWQYLAIKICPIPARDFIVTFVTIKHLKKVVMTIIYSHVNTKNQ